MPVWTQNKDFVRSTLTQVYDAIQRQRDEVHIMTFCKSGRHRALFLHCVGRPPTRSLIVNMGLHLHGTDYYYYYCYYYSYY